MCEAPSTWRAKIWRMEPRSFRAEDSGLIAAPGTPKAVGTPSFSRIRTAASMARIFAISDLARLHWLERDHRAREAYAQRDRFYFPRYGSRKKNVAASTS